ncbi:MAG: O-antigen ligase family protein, partial [Alphaproteobacteria bacterium]|nr:O-antigen ligase family protein [Alphaproteobacteria bacterium]
KKTSLLTAGLVGLFLAALLVTQSRGGFLACLLAGGVFLLGTVPQGSLSGRKLWGLFCIGALVLLALSFQKGRAPAAEIVSSLPAIGATATVTGRTALWESGRAMFMDHPLLGTGLASFPYYYGRYRNPLDTSDGYFVHMDPLQFAIETGILAPILFYGFLLAVLLRTLGALSHAGLARGQRLGILTPFCALLTLALHSHISFHLYMLPVLILAALLLAFWHRAAESITPQTTPCLVFPPRGKIATVVFVGGCVFFAVAGLWVARAGLETYFVTQARQAMAARDFPAGKTAIDRLCRFGPATSFRCGQYQALWDLDRLESDPSLRTDERIALIRRAFRSLDTAEHYHPAFSRIPYIRAQLYLASGDDGAAIAALTKAIAMNPVFLEAWRLLASIYKNRGETRKAIDTLHQAMLWPRPRDPASEIDLLMRIAFLYRDIGDVDHYDIYFFRARDIAEKQKKRHYSHLNNQ